MASLPTSLTVEQLASQRDALILALANGTKTVRFADGREQTYQDVGEMRQALSTIEDIMRNMMGQTGVRTAFAQHKRGEVAGGPGRLFDTW